LEGVSAMNTNAELLARRTAAVEGLDKLDIALAT
jgi:hypothetical protein